MSDPAVVERFVAESLAASVTGAPERRRGGFDNESWVVPVAGIGRVILRIARPLADPTKVRAAWEAHGLATEAGVPTGRRLHFSVACEALGDRACRIVEFVEGNESPGGLEDVSTIPIFFEALGAAMARAHCVRLGAFSSRVDGSSPRFGRWSEYVASRVPAIVRRSVVSGAFSEREITELLSPLPALCVRVDPVVTPTLCHRDLHLGNLIAGQDGALRAIVDWDAAEAWDAMVDFVKLRWQVLDRYPGAEEALWAGYAAGGDPPMLAERLHIVDLLELANGVANSRLEGWSHYEDQNRRWLAAALERSGAA